MQSSHRTCNTKRMVRINHLFAFSQFSCSPCFQWNCCFQCQRAPHLILQPTDQFLPRCFRLPLTIIKKQQQREKNGENWLSLDDFLVLMLTIFSIEMLISVPMRHTWYHSPQTNFCTATSAARLLLLKSSIDTKRMVKNDWVLMIFQFFCWPLFQWNCYFQCQRTTHDIAPPFTKHLICVVIKR